MLPFLPPIGSRIRYQYPSSMTFNNYLVIGYKDKNIAELYDLDNGYVTNIIMYTFEYPICGTYRGGFINLNPYITLLN